MLGRMEASAGTAALGQEAEPAGAEAPVRRVSSAAPGGRLRRRAGRRNESLHVRLSESEWGLVRIHAAEGAGHSDRGGHRWRP